jgi:arginyl-tRNA synthetase
VKKSLNEYVSDQIAGFLREDDVFRGLKGLSYQVEVPRDKKHGDLSSNVAMIAAPLAKKPPFELAQRIAETIKLDPALFSKIDACRPGFVNFYLRPEGLYPFLARALDEGDSYGGSDVGSGARIQIEYVSANPTGPLNVVSARAAAVGDSLIRLHKRIGYDAQAEFYVNDTGRQIELLGVSLDARLREHLHGESPVIPQNGYPGEYVLDIARAMPQADAEAVLNLTENDRYHSLARVAVDHILKIQREDLESFGVHFDRWFRESELHVGDDLDEALTHLRKQSAVAEKDGAVWLRSTVHGDTEDRVLIRSSGQPTYLLSDVAYHRNKHARGFSKVIDIWGPDHHGHIPRMSAAARFLGYPEDWLEILTVQWVRVMRGGQPVKMSKRGGEFVTLDELIEEVGKDCARFFFLMRRTNSHLDFDLDLAKRESDENPAYYVQYAHARISSILEFAREETGIPVNATGPRDLELLKSEEEFDLLKLIAFFPDIVRLSAEGREPHRVTTYLQSLAGAFHRFYSRHRVVTQDSALTRARLILVLGVRGVLRNGLNLIGVSAPEKM